MLLKGSQRIILTDEQGDRPDLKRTYWQLINSLGQSEKPPGVVVDARTKAGAHKVLPAAMTVKLIDARWREYGL